MSELVSAAREHEDAALLFRPSNASTLLDRIFAVLEDPPSDGQEASLHSFWDDNIHKVLHPLAPDGRSVHNCIDDDATCGLCPDFTFLVDTPCAFRGEEEGAEGSNDSKANLARK
jgi:hypothetical protein